MWGLLRGKKDTLSREIFDAAKSARVIASGVRFTERWWERPQRGCCSVCHSQTFQDICGSCRARCKAHQRPLEQVVTEISGLLDWHAEMGSGICYVPEDLFYELRGRFKAGDFPPLWAKKYGLRFHSDRETLVMKAPSELRSLSLWVIPIEA